MIEKKVVVELPHGLHARPAANFVRLASSFASEIKIVKNEKTANGKSIMGIMSMAVAKGEEITLIADGADEAEAIAALEKALKEEA
ncbi:MULTISPECIES: HPr family phosphocarrier protein [Bacillales]|jgi:catabolite repression HPr-like protein/phosphocarrier protein|uniref:Phosphocarrier protein HPr n=1 Tax=Brevibacillus aydinogluensis TaxID=927786 RepID=A0AA48RG67_9BACL|nr:MULTISPECIES: HPr family phosphocarrier protein [Bacillales]REK66328.1 MAG: HPr family phosphocarrier protein [Brevibacillus sp.]MBR8660984.1 HPr family phosphocarrier protein [Brevibacillus sp. NL20B1]MDT3416264.1 catabolite repression HPr-like protein/phosphocarrier protein [Brevibacillus aydinogluensis]NNV01166.1 HPr family phosphocarrier protein [Brevibacillus sp. MCWH]UFJ62135.1 HPr family phosphocarrier protein [Anoxybacillus sediminis]